MSESPSPIRYPNNHRLLFIGGASAACVMAWIAALATAPTSAAENMPFELYMALLSVAAVLTVVSVLLVVAYANLKASTDNQRTLAAALGALAAEQEQENERINQIADKLGRIDPWAIYTAVYEDLLKDRKN